MNKLEVSTEDYVSYETAKLLKRKGFVLDNITMLIGNDNKPFLSGNSGYEYLLKLNCEVYPAPTLQMAMKWLREKHKITIGIVFKGDRIYYEIHQNNEFVFGIDTPKSYEKVCDEAIKYCLENLI